MLSVPVNKTVVTFFLSPKLKGGAPANVHSQNERNENKMAKT
jgi:hypothetical protein